MGLVEVGVGLIPGLGRLQGDAAPPRPTGQAPGRPHAADRQAFETISTAKVAKSADEASDSALLRPDDGITMNRDRLLADAKAKALDLAETATRRRSRRGAPPARPTARAALRSGGPGLPRHRQGDRARRGGGGALAEVLSGGDTDITPVLDEDALLALERTPLHRAGAHARHRGPDRAMLATGKPLRN